MQMKSVSFFTLNYTKVEIVGKFLTVKRFLIVLHQTRYVSVSCYLRQVTFLFCLLQIMFGAIILVLTQCLFLKYQISITFPSLSPYSLFYLLKPSFDCFIVKNVDRNSFGFKLAKF